VAEPIQGKGVYLAPEGYWAQAQALCREQGTLFVMDEVQTGLGRTGKFFCHEHWGLEPDIITVSKALSGGYIPVGAMLTSDKIFSSVYASMEKALKHSTTFGRNQLAMVAGLATLQTFDDEDIIDRARRTGEAFEKGLAPLLERHEVLHEVRGKGLMIGLVFGEPTSRGARLRWRAMESVRTALFSQTVVVPLFHRHRILTQVAATTSTSSSSCRRSSAARRRSTTSSTRSTTCSPGRSRHRAPRRVRPHHGQGCPAPDAGCGSGCACGGPRTMTPPRRKAAARPFAVGPATGWSSPEVPASSARPSYVRCSGEVPR